jgi:DNA helicase II / ATP-dependent DNA helicase PcrA
MVDLTKLNAAQKQAVFHVDGPALVVAGAGTGKTAVISMRIAHLLLSEKIPAESILALTFTEKAATEMQDRVERLLPYGYVDSDILTFHALGDKILREFGFELGLPSDFVVMSGFQQSIVMRQVLDGIELSYYKKPSDPFSFSDALLQAISRLKDENISAEDFTVFAKSQAKKEDPVEAERIRDLSEIYTAYQSSCLDKGMIDHGDQIMLVISLLRSFPKILRYLQLKYKYILVDEYQDTNFSQSYLLKLLSKKHQNIMVVGDDDQSIYGFRGAAISNILSFTRDFPGAVQIVLNNNYRSSQKILDASYKLIQNNNPYRLEVENKINKKLTGDKNIPSDVVVTTADTLPVEMNNLAQQILMYNQEKNIPFSEIAVLLRTNRQAIDVANALQKHSVPYVVSESQNLFDQAEIKVLVNFIHILSDPSASAALYGLLASDLYQIPLDQIAQYSAKANRTHQNLEAYLLEQKDIPASISLVLTTIADFRASAQAGNAGMVVYDFLKTSGYLDRLVKQAEKDPAPVIQIQNITQFFSLVKDFERANADPHIYALWGYLVGIKETGSDIKIQVSPLDSDSVSVMTVHKAKGLEFSAVCVIDLTELTFPGKNMSDKIKLPDGLLSKSDNKVPWHIFEERRLFYVAITRAKQYLYLSSSFDHGGKRLKKPSRFIEETTGQGYELPKNKNAVDLSSLKNFEKLPVSPKDPLSKFISGDGWLHMTTGQVADYLYSPKEFWYFHVLSLPKGPFHSLIYGSAIHAAIETYYLARLQRKDIDINELYKVYENSWSSEGFVSLQHEKDQLERGKIVLKSFYDREQQKDDVPEHIEKEFHLKIDQLKLKISGRYDAVFDRNGKIEVRDFKTGAVDTEKVAQKKLKDSIQMKIYAMAWEKTHQTPVDSMSLYFVEHDILARTQEINHDKTLELLEKVTSGIRRGEFLETGGSRVKFENLV